MALEAEVTVKVSQVSSLYLLSVSWSKGCGKGLLPSCQLLEGTKRRFHIEACET